VGEQERGEVMNQEWGEDRAQRGWGRLWRAARPEEAHTVDSAALGEYAALIRARGEAVAAQTFPHIHAHLRAGCERCDADLQALAAHFVDEERTRQGGSDERWLPALLAHAWTYSAHTTAAYQVSEYPELTLQAVQTGSNTQLNLAARLRTYPERRRVDGWGTRVTRADGGELFSGVTDEQGAVNLPGITVRALMRARLEVKPPTS
jgi:hypothetical protein